jgi:hypothetical protein
MNPIEGEKKEISSNWVEKSMGLRPSLTILKEVILVELTHVGGWENWCLIFNFKRIYTTFFLLNKTVAAIRALPANIN